MSYTLALQCGCVVYVACDPKTSVAHTRVIESRGTFCGVRRHEVGARLSVWEITPDPEYQPQPPSVPPPENRSRRP
jgi:hypothetical protein